MSEVEEIPARSPGRRFAAALASVVTGALLFGVGLVGGWVAATQKAPVDPHGHDHAHGHDHGHGHAHAPALSPRTLGNLGVEVGEVRPSEFVRTRDVPAVV